MHNLHEYNVVSSRGASTVFYWHRSFIHSSNGLLFIKLFSHTNKSRTNIPQELFLLTPLLMNQLNDFRAIFGWNVFLWYAHTHSVILWRGFPFSWNEFYSWKIRSIFIELRKLMEPKHAEMNTSYGNDIVYSDEMKTPHAIFRNHKISQMRESNIVYTSTKWLDDHHHRHIPGVYFDFYCWLHA